MRLIRGRSVLPVTMSLVLAAAAILLPGAGATSCSVLDSCGACRNTTLCHWCPDQQCHVIGSFHGCAYGTYCYNNNQCQRELPEFKGYEAPSIAVLLGVFLVGSTTLFCGIAGISIAREYAKESAATRRQNALRVTTFSPDRSVRLTAAEPSGDGGYMTLAGDDDSEENDDDADDESDVHMRGGGIGTRGPSGPSAAEEGGAEAAAATATATAPPVPKGKRDFGRAGARRVGRSTSRTRRRRRRREAAAAEALPGPSPLARKVYCVTRLVCGTSMAVALLICGVVIGFAPHAPGVNVCNTEFDWGSIVHSIKSAGVEADFQILVSIYNPNVLNAEIEMGSALLYHGDTEVGVMAFEPALLAGGYVTDILLTITFKTEVWEEAHLGLEYETGQLAFLMDATISASVMWHGYKTYPFTFSINNYYIKVADTTGYDRSLCNCTQMMQGGKQPQQERPQLRYDQVPELPFDVAGDGGGGVQTEGEGEDRGDVLPAAEAVLPPTMGDDAGDRVALKQ
ncbi:unnamed protein product [Ectocarpus sp. CCAP 1310/34]|nr:unnamed protein product [Ectocarpus sp. CCAP 1310/34]